MIKNYFKTSWRNILKHKSISLINIFGFAIGIAACIIIFLYVSHELTYDTYNSKSERIVRVTTTMKAPDSDIRAATSFALLADALVREYPEVEAAVRLEASPKVVTLGGEVFSENSFYKSDQSIFHIFSFDFAEGSAEGALEKPNSIVITNTIAKRYFGTHSALGKTMRCGNEDLLVTGVVRDRPSNSDIHIDALLFPDFSKISSWTENLSTFTFILFKDRPDLKQFAEKIAVIDEKYIQPEFRALGAYYKTEFELEPLQDVHFSKNKIGDTPKGDKESVYIFSLLAAFILLIALLNYITLSTAKSTERAKEVGVRKVSGAARFQVAVQFLFESFFLVCISWLFAIILVFFTLPNVNNLVGTKLAVDGPGIFLLIILFIITLLLPGLYPAFVLSGFRPINVLKGSFKHSAKGVFFRKAVTVTQFAIASGLIMCTAVVYNQMKFIQEKDLGFNKEQLLTIYLPDDSLSRSSVTAFQDNLRNLPGVSDVTVGSRLSELGLGQAPAKIETDGKERGIPANFFQVDEHYLAVFQIRLKEGRNFSMDFTTDKTEAVLVNEAFVKMAGWKTVIGQEVHGFDRKGKVIGVVDNFYYKSLRNLVEPLVLVYNKNPQVNTTTVKIKSRELGAIKEVYQTHFPSRVFDYTFFDEVINSYYKHEQVTFDLFNKFTLFTILISCLGLYGLVSLITVQRSMEVSMRKILGASTSELFFLVSKDFIVLVLIALIISLPVAGVVMSNWLSNYAYHSPLRWWIFLIPFLLVLSITLAVISSEVIKVAMIKPIAFLRRD
ncbi:MAG: hypothetical protein C0490_00100 [Marivirga sp.]|nr:hypothetical protein [Marivirga sp.]